MVSSIRVILKIQEEDDLMLTPIRFSQSYRNRWMFVGVCLLSL